jgi:hypothetical protein
MACSRISVSILATVLMLILAARGAGTTSATLKPFSPVFWVRVKMSARVQGPGGKGAIWSWGWVDRDAVLWRFASRPSLCSSIARFRLASSKISARDRISRSIYCCIRPTCGLFGSLAYGLTSAPTYAWFGRQSYRRDTCMSNIRVVFSIDLTMTFVFGVMGVLASFNGLKLRMALRIRLAVTGLIRMRIASVFRVASTTRASL